MRLSGITYRNSVRLCLLAFFVFTLTINGQSKKPSEEEKIFRQIEEGIGKSSVDKFSGYFLNKVFISLATGTPKNYSANQAYYVIKNFLGIHNPTGFKFDFISGGTANPFAWGELKYIKNGMKGKAKVFITLINEKNQWKISQITIN